MSLLKNRVKAATATTGTGTVNLGSGVTPYRSWTAGGAVSGKRYSYLIEDGNDWEIGWGVYTAGSPDTLTRNLEASSTGALISLTGAATVAQIAKDKDIGQATESRWDVPKIADFAWNNQGTATATDTDMGINLVDVSSTTQIRSIEKAAPGTPFDAYLRYSSAKQKAANNQRGFWLRNSTNGRLIYFGFACPSTTAIPILLSQRWTNVTTFSATITTGVATVFPLNWLRVNVTSTTITFYHSADGIVWEQFGTETIATFLTATGGGSLDKVGVGFQRNGSAQQMLVNHFSFEAPSL